jgi:hypothetical protein
MAFYPCTVCGKRYRGAAASLYPALVRHTETIRGRVTVCPDCREPIQAFLSNGVTELTIDSSQELPELTPCPGCHEPTLAGDWRLFVTSYLDKSERTFYADVHGECCAGVALALGLADHNRA